MTEIHEERHYSNNIFSFCVHDVFQDELLKTLDKMRVKLDKELENHCETKTQLTALQSQASQLQQIVSPLFGDVLSRWG